MGITPNGNCGNRKSAIKSLVKIKVAAFGCHLIFQKFEDQELQGHH
jgi:hypothetical protein